MLNSEHWQDWEESQRVWWTDEKWSVDLCSYVSTTCARPALDLGTGIYKEVHIWYTYLPCMQDLRMYLSNENALYLQYTEISTQLPNWTRLLMWTVYDVEKYQSVCIWTRILSFLVRIEAKTKPDFPSFPLSPHMHSCMPVCSGYILW